MGAAKQQSRDVFRARGISVMQLLAIPLFVVAPAAMAAVLGLPLWPAMLAVAIAVLTCVTLVRLPRVVVTREAVTLRGIVNSTAVPISDVTGVEMLRGRVGKDAWILCVRTAHAQYPFNWVAFFRSDLATPWIGVVPPPRAERGRAEIESAIDRARSDRSES